MNVLAFTIGTWAIEVYRLGDRVAYLANCTRHNITFRVSPFDIQFPQGSCHQMDTLLPELDYLYETEWQWPWNKFPLEPEDLFTTLHSRFNTRPMRLQDPESFH